MPEEKLLVLLNMTVLQEHSPGASKGLEKFKRVRRLQLPPTFHHDGGRSLKRYFPLKEKD